MYSKNRLFLADLTTEHQKAPVGIDCRHPRFGWKLKSDGFNVVQKAYQITLFDGEKKVFATEKIESDQSIEVLLDGFETAPKTRYEVQVTVWDNQDREAFVTGSFETGRLGIPFAGSWVEPVQEPTPSSMDGAHLSEAVDESMIPRDENGNRTYEEFRPAQYIRIPLHVKKEVSKVRIYATSHGLYRLEVNGARPEEREFTPENTAYNKLLMYQTYDVTQMVQPGENVIGVILSDGWWAGRVGTTSDCCQYGDTIGLLLDAEVTYADGTTEIVTGEQGVSSTGPIIFSDLFVGEKYDATKEMSGWSTPGFDDHTWLPVEKKDYPKDHVVGQAMPPVRPVKVLTPTDLFTAPNGDLILDAGQVLAGVLEFHLDTEAGHEIRLEHFEVLGKDGNYFDSILNVNKDQTDIYVTKDGYQTYRPSFTYHGFRYVRISGWPGRISLDQFKVYVLASEMEDLGYFHTSDERLNQLQSNIWWSQVSNTISIPTDCPQREKAGWTGDIMAYAPTLCFNRGADAFLTSWMDNVRAEQLETGAIPMIVPYLKGYETFIKGNLGTDTSCGWGDTVIIVPYTLYKAYGDKHVLEQNYDAMTGWMEYIRSRAENVHPEGYESWDEEHKARSRYLWNTDFHFGDWLIPSIVLGNPDALAMNETAYATMGIVAPAYYAFSAKNMADISRILGKEKEASYYQDLYEKIRSAFITEYVHEDGTMDADFQGIYVIALQMDLVPEDVRPKMVQHLCDKIHANRDCLDTGFLSVLFLMDVLTDNGRSDVAYQLLFQTACPSWLYEVEKGATTMWESWGAVSEDGTTSTYSYNHYAFGCIGDWMYRHLGGLQILEPGYKKFKVAPSFDSGLTSVSVSEETPYGKAAIDWKIIEKQATVHVEVPVNTQAVIDLPGKEQVTVGSGSYDYIVAL
ncbi:MAG: family 78 glycoside hydrolase catalytic domain [Blautia sp.]|nr:family 78 glycoside hydrolase catalytic domain [Blautia sp.]